MKSPFLLAVALVLGACRTVPDCSCDAPPPPDIEDEALPPLSERKLYEVERIKERTPIKGSQVWEPRVEEMALRGPNAGTPPAARAQDPLLVFFGNLHSHTSYSDGSGLPSEAYAHARDTAGLDFLVVSEHNHRGAENGISSSDPRKDGLLIATDASLYHGRRDDGTTLEEGLIPQANLFTVPGEFVALYGQEFSSISQGNHCNVIDVPEVISDDHVANGDFGALLNTWLPANLDSVGQQAVINLNHPWNSSCPNDLEYGRDDFPDDFETWRSTLDARAQLIEVINGPSHGEGTGATPSVSDSEYRRYLNMGFHLAPSADQDNHFKTWGSVTDARTAVITSTLDKSEVLQALRNRHAYATLDKDLRIIATVEGELAGSVLSGTPSVGDELEIEVSIDDDDEPEGTYWIEVFGDTIDGEEGDTRAKLVATFGPMDTNPDPNDPNIWSLEGLSYDGWDYAYFRVLEGEVNDPEKVAWLAPVWFE